MYALYLSIYLLRCRLLGRARRFGVHVRRRGAGHIVAAPARLQLVNCTVSNLRSLSKLRLHLILFIDCMGLAPTRPLAPSHSFPSPFNYRVERAVYTTGTRTHTSPAACVNCSAERSSVNNLLQGNGDRLRNKTPS